jgi:hypothetical protein
VISQYLAGKISRDSLFKVVYGSGNAREFRIREMSKEQLIAEVSRCISELQKNAKYKFAVEYLLKDIDSSKYDSLAHEEVFPSLIRLNDSLILEAYDFGCIYVLYRCPSFDGRTTHFILGKKCPIIVSLILFDVDTLHPTIVDRFNPGHNISMSYSTINGGNIINVSYSSGSNEKGTDSECTAMLAIENNRFHSVFNYTNESQITSEWITRITHSILEYTDLNNDGYSDIILNTTKETINDTTGATDTAQVISRFIWDNRKHMFIKSR